MRNNLFLLFFLFFGSKVEAKNFEQTIYNPNQSLQLYVSLNDTVKKKSLTAKTVGTKAIIPPPLTTAGSACKDPSQATVQVFLNASGGSGDVLEWYASQSSSTILHTGSIYAPLVGSTTTYYVRTRSGADFSIRVPVVASVYVNPPAVILSMSPSESPICQGTPIIFKATGGGDFYEFSVDGTIKQVMSTSNTFSTSDLTNGQTVKVRSRYGVIYDGVITETAWGKGALEDNWMSAALSPNAVDGYISSIKMSSSEDQLVFGISGKLSGDKSMLLFLDTKPGGFNVANYGDEPITPQLVKGFNYFNNNNPYNNFDSYFFPDYCLAIQSSDEGTTYFADVIELKSGTSTKVNLGSASTGSPSASMGVNSGNASINDYDLGFEVGVLKALLGYTVGDIKFFALTMQDDIVTNSFISPETVKIVDYGTGFVDYNSENPNAVVVSGDALKPCYKEDSKIINIAPLPTISGVPSVCVGSTTALTGSGTPNTTNPWTSATPSVAIVNNSGIVTGVLAGTSLIRYTDINGCAITQTVTVNPLPTITGASNLCVGSTTTLTGSATPNASNPWVSASPTIATVSNSGVVTGVSAGTSVITYTNSIGCTVSQTITVNPLPIITSTLNICIGLSTTLTGSATPNATNPWVAASPSIATINSSGVVTGVAVGTSLITYTNSNGCEITQTFTVNALPTISGDSTVCVGLTTTLTGSATPNATNPWVSATPSVATVSSSGVVTGVSAGTSVITYTNSDGCTVTQTLTVNPLPAITGAPNVCIGFSTTLTGSATSNATNPWVSATPTVATVNNFGVVRGVSAGTSVITYTNSNGCTINQIFTVYASPTISGNPTVCVGLTTSLTGSGTPNATNPWTSATPTVATVNNSGVVTGVSAGTSLISYTDINGCTITQIVTVNPLPAIIGTSTLCVGSTTILTGSATPNTTNPWVSASPTIATVSNSGVVTGVSAGTSVITYTNSNGCTVSQTVSVNPLPTITGTLNVCIGLSTTLTGLATPNAVNSWVSASPSIATINSSGVVTGVAVGTSLITYTNSNGCEITQTFIVNPLPIATLSSNDSDNTFCSGTSVIFTAGGGVNYNFRVNNSSVQNGTSATYVTSSLTNGQNVDVLVTNASGCISTSSVITNAVLPLPVQPTLSINTQPSCISSSGSFKISNYNAAYSYTISPSTGVVRSVDVVTAPSGNYIVTATFGTCSASASITVNPIPPQIQFEIIADCIDKDYVITASPLASSYDPNNVDYQWKDSSGSPVGTNSNILNVSDLIASTPTKEVFPLNYSLTVMSIATGCETNKTITVETIYCNIQKGISPDDNGLNDYFDLTLMDVKNLEIFNRYGIKVYEQSNYTDQWKGQSNKGDNLPSATYYYVIELNKGEIKTGWIYLIREK